MSLKKIKLHDVQSLFKYGFFGLLSTGINFLLLYILMKMGVYYIVSNIISYIIAVYLSYYFNKWWVFSSGEEVDKSIVKIKYFFIRIISLFIDSILLYLCVDMLRKDIFVSKVLISILIIFVTYLINRYYIFSS